MKLKQNDDRQDFFFAENILQNEEKLAVSEKSDRLLRRKILEHSELMRALLRISQDLIQEAFLLNKSEISAQILVLSHALAFERKALEESKKIIKLRDIWIKLHQKI